MELNQTKNFLNAYAFLVTVLLCVPIALTAQVQVPQLDNKQKIQLPNQPQQPAMMAPAQLPMGHGPIVMNQPPMQQQQPQVVQQAPQQIFQPTPLAPQVAQFNAQQAFAKLEEELKNATIRLTALEKQVEVVMRSAKH